MGAISSSLGLPSTFVAPGGRSLQVSPWTYEIQGMFERHLESRAAEALRRLRPLMTAEDYDKAIAGVTRDAAIGVYSFGTEECSKALQTPDNVAYVFWLCVNFHHRDVSREEVHMWARDIDTYQAMVRAMNEANAAPNSTRPTTTSASSA